MTIKQDKNAVVTSARGFKAVFGVDALNVVGERDVGHQGLVPVDVVDGKLERQLVQTDQFTLARLQDAAWYQERVEHPNLTKNELPYNNNPLC